MLIADELQDKPDIATYRVQIEHSECAGRFIFDIAYFVNIEAWPDFREVLETEEIGTAYCATCRTRTVAKFPIIVEVPSRNLLIFATHAGDDTSVDAGFKEVFSNASQRLPAFVTERAQRRPYTFVHGWRGLKALLDVFEGRSPLAARQQDPPYPHPADTGTSLSMLRGYIYGDLFFHYPAQRLIDDLVCMLLVWSQRFTEPAHIERIIEVMEGFVDIVGAHHPWLAQELGRLYLEKGELDEASRWLELAAAAQHQWLAVTASFLNMIPPRRSEQEARLPHARPSSELSDVAATRHSVMRQRPALPDYGLWHFPTMESQAHPASYTTETVLAARGLVHGNSDRFFIDERRPAHDPFLTHWNTMELLNATARAGRSLEAIQGFWQSYVRGRWLSRPSTTSQDLTVSAEWLLQEIDASLAQLREDDEISRFYLEGSARELRRHAHATAIYQETGDRFDEAWVLNNHEGWSGQPQEVTRPAQRVLPVDIPLSQPGADPERAHELNRKYQEEVARWKALPRWKRRIVKKPEPPRGI